MWEHVDRLIAEEVMAWKIRDGVYVTSEGIRPTSHFKPSLDAGAAWEVVEKIRPLFSYFTLRWLDATPARQGIGPWMAEFAQYAPSGTGVASGMGETAQLAICRAAVDYCRLRTTVMGAEHRAQHTRRFD